MTTSAMFRNIVQSEDAHKRFSFEAHNVDLSIMNGIRRVILTDIPVIGFRGEEVTSSDITIPPSIQVLQNNTPLHNEFMLHRFGLIPIHLKENDVDDFNEEDYVFELNVHNDGNSMINVTTKDFTVLHHGKPLQAQAIFPANTVTQQHILITRLRPNEHLHIKGTAVKSTARENASFSPVSMCTLSFGTQSPPDPTLSILDRERAFAMNEYGDPTIIVFSIESECALSPSYLIKKALNIMLDKTRNIANLLSADGQVARRTNIGMEFHFDEDDTVGNMFQSEMHDYYVREKHLTSKGRTVSYVGYYPPHPLETSVVVKVCLDNHETATDEDYIEVMHDSCARMVTSLETVLQEWTVAADK